MDVVSIMTPKGGVGKTTTASTLAYILGQECGGRVLVVDADPQGDISKMFGCFDTDTFSISLETESSKGMKRAVRKTMYPNIDILPTNGRLMQTSNVLANLPGTQQIHRFSNIVSALKNDYGWCICDCGRLLDLVVLNILVETDLVISPIKAGGFEVNAMENLLREIAGIRKFNKKIDAKILLTMARNTKAFRATEKWAKEHSGFNCFKETIGMSTVIEQATIQNTPLPDFAKKAAVTCSYRKVVDEIYEEVK